MPMHRAVLIASTEELGSVSGRSIQMVMASMTVSMQSSTRLHLTSKISTHVLTVHSLSVDGRPVQWNFDRLNYYQIMPDYDFRDVDGDGVGNYDDAAPFDPTGQRIRRRWRS